MRKQEAIYKEEFRQVRNKLRKAKEVESVPLSLKAEMLDQQIKDSTKLQEDIKTRIKHNDVRLVARSNQ